MAALRGAAVALVYEPRPQPRAMLSFFPPRDAPFTVTMNGVREASFGVVHAPALRVAWRYAAPVKSVTFSAVQSFEPGAPAKSVRVEVELDGSAPLALEGDGLVLGPVAAPPPVPIPPRSTQWS